MLQPLVTKYGKSQNTNGTKAIAFDLQRGQKSEMEPRLQTLILNRDNVGLEK